MESSSRHADPSAPNITNPPNPTPTWTYPTRLCRICREDVVPTVTLYPPGLPPAFQRPIVEYKNEDEYGRLIKPCHCRGGMRYIHELCLLRSRTESVRPGSLWKCHECRYEFNFKRLTLQRYLASNLASGILTALVMLVIIFILGFVADPIIGFYVDPYDTLVGNEPLWQNVDVNDSTGRLSGWAAHFWKGMVSMGLVGFVKTALLNPFQWWNLRNTGFVSGRSGGTTGRDRTVQISWVAILAGVGYAFYFFYQWVQTIIGRTLQHIGNNIVDTQLPGDDEDLKPPPGFRVDVTPTVPPTEAPTHLPQEPRPATKGSRRSSIASSWATNSSDEEPLANSDVGYVHVNNLSSRRPNAYQDLPSNHQNPTTTLNESSSTETAFSSALDSAQSQGWSFRGL